MKKLKKAVCALLALTMIFAVMSATAVAAGSSVMGDVDSDGRVTVEDAMLALNYSAGKRQLTAEQLFLADVTYDGTVNSTDALRILLYISGKISTLNQIGGEEGDDIII